MSKFLKTMLPALALLLLTAACSPSYVANADWDRRVNLRDFSTFRFAELPPEKQQQLDPILNNAFNQSRVEQAVAGQLRSRRFQMNEDTADLTLRFYTTVKSQQETRMMGNPNPWWWGINQNTYTRNYDESTLIVEMYDARTNKLVWQGWAAGEQKSNKRNQDVIVGEKVARIFNEFPVERMGGRSVDPVAYH